MLTPEQATNLGTAIASIQQSNATIAMVLRNLLGTNDRDEDDRDLDLNERGESDDIERDEDDDPDDGTGYAYSREFNSKG